MPSTVDSCARSDQPPTATLLLARHARSLRCLGCVGHTRGWHDDAKWVSDHHAFVAVGSTRLRQRAHDSDTTAVYYPGTPQINWPAQAVRASAGSVSAP